MSRTDIHDIEGAAHTARLSCRGCRPARVYTLPTVREIPPVSRPGAFDSTW